MAKINSSLCKSWHHILSFQHGWNNILFTTQIF